MTKPITGLTVFGSNTSGTTTQLDNNFTSLTSTINNFNTYSNYLLDSGSSNNYAATLGANLTGSVTAGLSVLLKIANSNSGASTFDFNSTGAKNIKLPNGSDPANLQMLAGTVAHLVYDGTNWILVGGSSMMLSNRVSTALSADVDLNNPAVFFDGPSVAQTANVGVWFAMGNVLLVDTSTQAGFVCKLWDGASQIAASASVINQSAGLGVTVSLSGIFTLPAGNIRISVQDGSSALGKILFNSSGLSMDSQMTVVRIG